MTSIAILTAVYDSYDALKPTVPQHGMDVDWVCVTDDEDLKNVTESQGWRVVYEPRPGTHPNRAAKHPKYEPWKYTDAGASIWVDASFRIVSDRFAAEALPFADPIAQFPHPWRDCLYAEADESAPMAKYADEPVAAQAEHYRRQGHPERWGLWATGVITRRHTEPVRRLGRAWLEETYKWSFQDQISHPHVCREVGLRPAALPGTHMSNPWLRYEGSARHACG